MTSVLDQLFELLKDKIPRKQDQKLLKNLLTKFKEEGADSVKKTISELIKKIAEDTH